MSHLEVIILAAGKGTRMGGETAKVLTDFGGRPMLSYVLDAVALAHEQPPIVVVGFQAEKVKEAMGKQRYVHQEQQLGTGHAVKIALADLSPDAKHVIVIYGDHPLVDDNTIRALHESHARSGQPVTLCTIRLPDYNEWRMPFYDFGRIVRDENGKIVKTVERVDATDAEKAITEVSPGFYCFSVDWLRDRINTINSSNPKGEFYLTSLTEIAQKEGAVLNSIEIPAYQALGVNTPEQLKIALQFVKK